MLWVTTIHQFRKIFQAIINWVIQKYATSHNHPQPPTTIHNHTQPPKKPSTTTHNHPKNHLQPPTATHSHPQPSTTTQKLHKKTKTCHIQLFYCTLDVNAETDVDFDSDMKQWYIYMCVCLCVSEADLGLLQHPRWSTLR